MSDKVQAVARIQITVEFAIGGGAWPSDATIEQVHKQAKDAAITALQQGLIIHGLSITSSTKTPAVIVGEPKVTAILVEEKR